MLFATDLDRTLIYSRAASSGLSPLDERDLRVVEYLDGAPLSYMTARAIGLLHELWEVATVVPATTRTLAQYARIELFSSLVPDYAVAANGGHIVHRGVHDGDWHAAIRAELAASCSGAEEMAAEVALAGRSWAQRVRIADDLFVYAIVDREKLASQELADLAGRFERSGWVLSLQGRKLYAVPRPLDKWRAVQEVCRRTGETFVASAGDSLLDRCLLDNSAVSARPPHGELEASGHPVDFVASNRGARAAEELLGAALAWVCHAEAPSPQ